MSDDVRDKFEAFAKTKDMPLNKIINNLGKTVYRNWCVQHAFESYQAAQAEAAALVDGLKWLLERIKSMADNWHPAAHTHKEISNAAEEALTKAQAWRVND